MRVTLRLSRPPAALPLALTEFLMIERAKKVAAVEYMAASDAAPTQAAVTTAIEASLAAEAGSASPPPTEAPQQPSRRKVELREVEKILRDLAPGAFCKPAKPLKIGICNDLLDLLAGEVEPIAIRRFLGCWCRRDAYLFALAYGGPRFDLDGQPAGEVTPEQQARARRLLAERGLTP